MQRGPRYSLSKLNLQALAKHMRQNPTPMESRLWQRLRASQLQGFKFRQQHIIEPAIVDFCCPSIGLIVEIDGDTHDPDRDCDRDIGLGQLGYTVLRFTNSDVATNIDGVLETIVARAQGLTVRQWNRGVTHPPTPSLGREGAR